MKDFFCAEIDGMLQFLSLKFFNVVPLYKKNLWKPFQHCPLQDMD